MNLAPPFRVRHPRQSNACEVCGRKFKPADPAIGKHRRSHDEEREAFMAARLVRIINACHVMDSVN